MRRFACRLHDTPVYTGNYATLRWLSSCASSPGIETRLGASSIGNTVCWTSRWSSGLSDDLLLFMAVSWLKRQSPLLILFIGVLKEGEGIGHRVLRFSISGMLPCCYVINQPTPAG
jgi:hypothetical protein